MNFYTSIIQKALSHEDSAFFEFEVESLMWMGQNLKAIASNIKPQTSNLKPQTSNLKHLRKKASHDSKKLHATAPIGGASGGT